MSLSTDHPYKDDKTAIKELKNQIYQLTRLIEYYRSNSNNEMDFSVAPVGYFITENSDGTFTAARVVDGYAQIISSHHALADDAFQVCWDHVEKIDSSIGVRRREAIAT